MIVDQQQLAEIFDVSPRTIRNWQNEGMPCQGDRKSRKYETADCIAWFSSVRGAGGTNLTGSPGELPSQEESDRRWKDARATLQEIEVAERRGELVNRDVAERIFGEMLDRIRHALNNIPTRFATQVLGLESPREAEEALREIIRHVLEDLSGPVADELEFGGE